MSVSRDTDRPTISNIGASALGAQLEQSVSGSLSHDSNAWISVSFSRANAGVAGITLNPGII